ncbi:MAG: HD domain-containing protein [Candidatus Heimdallarchaeaceae archaeon]
MKKPGKPENEIEKIKEFFLPDRDKIIYILKLLGLSRKKIKHSIEVADLALKIADEIKRTEGVNVDRKIVEAGALLHDVGLVRTFDDLSPEHSVIGSDIIRKVGLPERVARCAEVHEMAGGLTRKIAEELKFPILPLKEDYSPQTLEEEIVTAADLLQYLIREAPEEFGYKKYDPWKDPGVAKEALFLYLQDVYRKKLNKELTIDQASPVLEKGYEICKEFIKYVKPSISEKGK